MNSYIKEVFDNMPIDYANGKIYRIVSDKTDVVYIGCTTQPLSKRMANHRSSYKSYQKGKSALCSSFVILEYGDAKIELIEPFACENKKELMKREREIIDASPTACNKIGSPKSYQEWDEKHKEKIKNYNKLWKQNNRERVRERARAWREKNREHLREYNRLYQREYHFRTQILRLQRPFNRPEGWIDPDEDVKENSP